VEEVEIPELINERIETLCSAAVNAFPKVYSSQNFLRILQIFNVISLRDTAKNA